MRCIVMKRRVIKMAEFVEVMKQKKRMCDTYNKDCDSTVAICPLDYDRNGKNIVCTDFLAEYPQESEEIIMKWAKEHPAKTNADKFKEVFGYDAELDVCSVKCPDPFDMDSNGCNNCKFKNFWQQEYKEPKGENI